MQSLIGGVYAELEVVSAQLRVARHRHRAHAEAGEHRQHPLDPAADERHHHVPALDPARRHRPREPGAPRDQSP